MIKTKRNGARVWVTFTYTPAEAVETVLLSGEWNDWKAEPMKRKKSGEFSLTKVLRAGESYEFGYKVNGERWETEAECPSVPSPFASHNSKLEL